MLEVKPVGPDEALGLRARIASRKCTRLYRISPTRNLGCSLLSFDRCLEEGIHINTRKPFKQATLPKCGTKARSSKTSKVRVHLQAEASAAPTYSEKPPAIDQNSTLINPNSVRFFGNTTKKVLRTLNPWKANSLSEPAPTTSLLLLLPSRKLRLSDSSCMVILG